MVTNCEGCTIYEKCVGADGFPAYMVHHIPNVYWEQCIGQSANKNANKSNMEQEHSIYLAIPATSLTDYTPKYNDLLVKGLQPVSQPPDKSKSYTILTVTDCLYGSPAVQHIEVTAM